MAASIGIRNLVKILVPRQVVVPLSLNYSGKGPSKSSKQGSDTSPAAKPANPFNVPGPGKHVFRTAEYQLGPGADKKGEYKNPEYYMYHDMSYVDLEVELTKHRLPQPESGMK